MKKPLSNTSIRSFLLSCICSLFLVPPAAAQEQNDSIPDEARKVNYVVLPMYDYRPVLEHSVSIFGKMICALSDNQTFISDLVASKSLSNTSYNIQLKNEFYMRTWRYSVNASLMKQVNQLPAQKMGIDHPGLLGTELNMGYIQGFAKRKLSPRIYGGLGLEWSFSGKYQLAFSDLEGAGLEDRSLTLTMVQPIISLEYDTRDNLVYPTKGFFITNQTNFISDAFGSTLESLGADLHPVEQSDYFFAKNITRATFYASLDGTWRSVLATRYGMRVGLGDVPVSMWENANNWIRGYREGSFTGKQLHFLDLEWRKYFTNRMGFALFGTAGFVGNSLDDTFSADGFVPAAGAGLRIRVLRSKPVAFRFDYALGRDGEQSVYFGLTEYF